MKCRSYLMGMRKGIRDSVGVLDWNILIEIYIYFVYTLYLYKCTDIHKLPIRFKTHAALRLIKRFDLDIEEFRHLLKTGKMIKKPKKDGHIGIIQRKLGNTKIRIKFTIRQKTLWIITVEGGEEE
jgi:hypothetical protein